MIRSLFFPEQVGSYYLFGKRIIGFDVGKTHITATQVFLKGRAVTIEKIITEKIDATIGADYNESVSDALKKIIKNVDTYDEIRTAFASASLVFKELRLPFIGREHIAMTIGFEVEPLLPFALDDAIIDFIVTREHQKEKSSEIIVVAAQKQHVAEHIALFEAAGITPYQICVDLFSIYSFYSKSIQYASTPGGVVLIDLGSHTSTLAYILDGQLRLVRSLSRGTVYIAKSVSDATGIPIHQVMETMIRYGVEKTDDLEYHKALTQALGVVWREIAFTLQSFAVQAGSPQTACHLILFGGGSALKGLSTFVTKLTGNSSELWNIDAALLECGIEAAPKVGVSRMTLMSISTALPLQPAADCSLRKKEFTSSYEASFFTKQFFTACALILCMFGALITITVIQVQSLHVEVEASENEARLELKSVLDGLVRDQTDRLSDQDSLEDFVEASEGIVKKEETLWFSFANPARTSFLKYLLELTSIIDKKGLGFTINKLTIADGVMTLDAQVRDHDALKLLEKELKKSKLLAHFETQQDPIFKAMKIKLVQAG